MKPEEEHTLIELLSKLHFPCSKGVFEAIYKNLVVVAVELAVFTPEGKMLLLPRPVGDTWAGQVHLPGSIMLPGDTEESVLTRIMTREIGNPHSFSSPVFINRLHFRKGGGQNENELGQEVGLLFGCIYTGEIPKDALLSNPQSLPPNIISFQRILAEEAYRWFVKQHF